MEKIKTHNMYFEELTVSIIERAVIDIKDISKLENKQDERLRIKNRKSARVFFNSHWFEELCNYINVNSVRILEKLKPFMDTVDDAV